MISLRLFLPDIPPEIGGMNPQRFSWARTLSQICAPIFRVGQSDAPVFWKIIPISEVGIALAMLLHPSLLLADEPTSALDVVSQAQVLRELQALQQKEQTGMVLVTHNLAVLEQMADRVAVLKDGNIVEQGETRTVFDHPKDEYTKNLLAAVPGRGKNDA